MFLFLKKTRVILKYSEIQFLDLLLGINKSFSSLHGPLISIQRSAYRLRFSVTEKMWSRMVLHSQRARLVRVKQARKDSQERNDHLGELRLWKMTEWSEKYEVLEERDSCGKCFSAVPGGNTRESTEMIVAKGWAIKGKADLKRILYATFMLSKSIGITNIICCW